MGIDVIIIGVAQQRKLKTEVFALVRNSYRTLQLALKKTFLSFKMLIHDFS